MRRYTADDERRIRLRSMVRAWTRAGLLDPAQEQALGPRLETGLRRTNDLLRAVLALFTAVIVGASVGLALVLFEIRSDAAVASALAVAGAACYALAEYCAGTLRLYRYGVEETLAAAAIVLCSLAALVGDSRGVHQYRAIVPLLVATAAAAAVYARFGLVYAAIAGMACGAAVAFQLDLPSGIARVLAAATLAAVCALARVSYLQHGDDYPGDDYDTLQAAAYVGVYAVLNLQLPAVLDIGRASPVSAPFYWASYAATWLLPAAALAAAVRSKDRPLIVAAIATALATLATNKPYLGVPRQSWDPMALGILLVGGVVALRRWLDAGPERQRRGYTAAQILRGGHDWLGAAANASVVVHGRLSERELPADRGPSPFEGGRSGGGGSSAGY